MLNVFNLVFGILTCSMQHDLIPENFLPLKVIVFTAVV
jgi:hypothetical protein